MNALKYFLVISFQLQRFQEILKTQTQTVYIYKESDTWNSYLVDQNFDDQLLRSAIILLNKEKRVL